MYGVNVYPLLTTIFGATILQLHQVIHRHIYAPSALFSTKVQKFLIILRIYNCSNLPFSVTVLYYNL